METIEIGGSQVDMFTMKKIQENANAWSDISKWPTCMLNILLRAGVHENLFGKFSFQSAEIHDTIFNHDDGAMQLLIFGTSDYLDPNLVSRAIIIPLGVGGKCRPIRKIPST